MAITIDGPARLILLDGATTQSIREMYSRWVDWANSGDNQKYLPAFSVIADPPTIPVYATLENGWLVRPLGGDYTLTLTDGFLYDAGSGDPIAAVASGQEPRVRYENPLLAVGFAAGSGLDAPQAAKLDRIHALLDLIEGGNDHAEMMRIIAASVAGRSAGAKTGTMTFYGLDDSTPRIVAGLDGNGNRTSIATDGT